MQTSIPSLKKQSHCPNFLKALLLITILQLQVSSTLIVNPVNEDSNYEFNLESLKNEKTKNKLDFTKGTWTIIKKELVLEFAPEEATMLIFSFTDD
jgi:hypothetical protein